MPEMTAVEFTIGQSIRAARDARGLSRSELAAMSDSSTSTLARLELYGHVPKTATLVRLADVLDLSLDDLLSAR